ncbi:Peptide:N-glycanase [Plasmopara halstedii]|uniref:Peptide:N-glycanase n=1 Tax=Plasmopara halstedii TaxID=4781 RepID=A0A0P1AAS6_PLAHL|nr:Peptide:N-glycanase [Plasmopara halstedii]CEG37405.1 Peptide:N-glycanase [Plasmopara halstedii]|eukprot:XP_024573774.1 Peptide:N-glycanase [Plasmopara halstedii]
METAATIDVVVVYQLQEYYVSAQTSSNRKELLVDLLQCQLLSLVGVLPNEQILFSSSGEILYSHNKTQVATIAVSTISRPRFFLSARSNPTLALASDWRQICTKCTFGDAAVVQPAYRKIVPDGGDPLVTLICESCARTCTTEFQPVSPLELASSKSFISKFISDLVIVSGDIDVGAPPGYTKLSVALNHSASGDYVYLCLKRGGPRALTQIHVLLEEMQSAKSSAEFIVKGTEEVIVTDYDTGYGSHDTAGTRFHIGYDTVQVSGNMEDVETLAITEITVIVGEQVGPPGFIKITRNLNKGILGSVPVHLWYRVSPLGGFVCDSSREHNKFGECLFATRHLKYLDSVIDVMNKGLSSAQKTLAAERLRVDANAIDIHYRQHQPGMLKRLQSGLERAQSYENKHMQEEALKRIPVDNLHERAQANPSPMASYRDELIKQLLHWFKHDFFTWMNEPSCSACNNEKTRLLRMDGPSTAEEIAGQASRVEVYTCPACGALTRFPRYNDPIKLLDTRTGRCGEWANCFTLCCRAMGYEARYVLDVTDHVWTEIYSDHLKRWLHCDSCEEQLDCPLTYEVGWGKKLSYIFSFGHDEVADTARRYTQNWADMRTRRQDVSETWLQMTINQMNNELRKRQTPERVAILTMRAESELKELLCTRSAQKSEIMGRVSGSAEWKNQRNEDGKGEAKFAKATTTSKSVKNISPGLQASNILQQICKNLVIGCQSTKCFNPFCFTGRTRTNSAQVSSDVNERAVQAIQVINGLNHFHPESLVSMQCSNRSIELRNFLWKRHPLLYLSLQDLPSRDDKMPLIDISGNNNHVYNSQHCALRKPFRIPYSGEITNTDTEAKSRREDRAFGMQLHGGKFLEISKLTVPRDIGYVMSFLVRIDQNESLTVQQSDIESVLKVLINASKPADSVEFCVGWKRADRKFVYELVVNETRTKSSVSDALLLSFGQYAHVAVGRDKSSIAVNINGVEVLGTAKEYQENEQVWCLQGPAKIHSSVNVVISHVAVIPTNAFEDLTSFCTEMKKYFVSAPPLVGFGPDGKVSDKRCSEVAAEAQSGYRVAQVLLWGHEFLDGIQFVYEKTLAPGDTNVSSAQSTSLHGALMGNEIAKRQSSQPSVTLHLLQDEVVTRLSGRKGHWIDSITLETNFGRTISCGGKGGGEFTVSVPAHTEIRSISCKAGNHLTDLCVFVLESTFIKDIEDQVVQQLQDIFSSCETLLRSNAIAAALRYLENIARQPEEPKFQRIRASNKYFAGSIGALGDEIARSFISWCGFEETVDQSEKFYIFRPRQPNGDILPPQLTGEAYKRLHFLNFLKNQ